MKDATRKFWAVTRWARAAKFWVYVALALAAIFVGNEARAQVGPTECTSTNRCPRPTAYEACMVAKSQADAVKPPGDPQINCTTTAGPTENGAYQCGNYWQGCSAYVPAIGRNSWNFYGCPAGEPWNEATKTCGDPCDDAPDLGPNSIVSLDSNGKRCSAHEGALCEYERATDGMAKSRVMGIAPNRKLFASGWTATGQQCSSPTPTDGYDPDKPICQAVGTNGARECIDPNGRHCITFASGLRTCWESNLGEEGQRQSADGTEGSDTQIGNPPPANEPPQNMQNPQPDGPPSNTEINGVGRNTQTYNGSGTIGPGQPNTGTGGNDPGAPGGDGGDGDGEGDDPGAPGAGVGDLYEGTGKTVGDVVGEFRTRMENAPIASAATGFLTVSVANSCPTWSVPATEFWDELQFTYHCNGPLADALGLGGWLVLALAAWAAFRWAFL